MGCKTACIGDVAAYRKTTVKPLEGPLYNCYSLPAFDNNRTPETLDGSAILSSKLHVEKGDILVNKLNMRFKRIWPLHSLKPNSICSTEFMPLVPNDSIDPRYLLYVLTSDRFTNRLSGMRTGTSGSHQRVKPEWILEYSFPLPDMIVQERIGSVLGTIDEKIALNNQLNGYLEELVNSEFAKRFDSHGPKTPLKNVLSISTKSLNPQRHVGEVWEHYSIPAFDATRWPTFELADGIKSSKYVVDNNSILISKLNPSIKRMWVPACLTDKAVCSTEFIVYKPLESSHKSFYCAAINAEEFTAFLLEHVTGSTGSRQRTQPKATHNYPMPNPSRIEIESFCTFADPIYQQIQANEIESQRLRTLRDALLPKLMSGEIDVSKVELTQLNSHLGDC